MILFQKIIVTAQEKIDLSEYNLKRLKNGGLEANFHFDLSNFLSSTQSVYWHLLYDYAKEFSLPVDGKLYPKKFKKLAKENQKALEFINWYNKERKKISQEGFFFLKERRNRDVHEGASDGILEVTKSTDDSWTETSLGYSVNTAGKHYHIYEIPENEEPVQFCEKYLNRLKKMVNDAERIFKPL